MPAYFLIAFLVGGQFVPDQGLGWDAVAAGLPMTFQSREECETAAKLPATAIRYGREGMKRKNGDKRAGPGASATAEGDGAMGMICVPGFVVKSTQEK